VDQTLALVAAQSAGAADREAARPARGGRRHQQAALPSVPAQGGTAAALSPTDPDRAPEHLTAWLAWASRSQLKPFVKLARTIRKYRDGILAAVRLGLSNARLEGLNSKVRLISHRSYGFHGPQPLISLIYLCAGAVNIDLPFTPNS
jgi:hypothetical protein